MITFFGHFTIGEKVTRTQLVTVEAVEKLSGDLAILVNDIDLKRRLTYYTVGGVEKWS